MVLQKAGENLSRYLIIELDSTLRVEDATLGLKDQKKVLLYSSSTDHSLGRFSILGYDPYDEVQDSFELLQKKIDGFPQIQPHPYLPLLGGALGVFSYEAMEQFLPIRFSKPSVLNTPTLCFYFFDQLIIWDHYLNQVFCVLSHVDPFVNQLRAKEIVEVSQTWKGKLSVPHKLKAKELSLKEHIDEAQYYQKIDKIKQYIKKGHTYQANLSQRFSIKQQFDPLSLFWELHSINPVPYGGYMEGKDWQLLSGSPECLVRLQGKDLLARPIAGTRKKSDAYDFRAELANCPKERAEHAMLVDLIRNDLGKVAKIGSVLTDTLFQITEYAHVVHLESTVRAIKDPAASQMDVFCALFPGGTITGVPKIRTIEILQELEPHLRDFYTGSMGYFSICGNIDFNILIRSFMIQNGECHFQVGGGITYDAVDQCEYKETLNKALSQLKALGL